ncbi:hypothetical protein B0H14DRAFT_2599284 [Mycena olivaceomarginata]|nr:hypothetical protein B0H14DRAFT_2599284 [Mycena olivaceomarginata]
MTKNAFMLMPLRPSIKEIYDEADPRGAPPLRLSGHILQESSTPDLPPSSDFGLSTARQISTPPPALQRDCPLFAHSPVLVPLSHNTVSPATLPPIAHGLHSPYTYLLLPLHHLARGVNANMMLSMGKLNNFPLRTRLGLLIFTLPSLRGYTQSLRECVSARSRCHPSELGHIKCANLSKLIQLYSYFTAPTLSDVAAPPSFADLHFSRFFEIAFDNSPCNDGPGFISTYTLNRHFKFVSVGDKPTVELMYGNSTGHSLCNIARAHTPHGFKPEEASPALFRTLMRHQRPSRVYTTPVPQRRPIHYSLTSQGHGETAYEWAGVEFASA